VRTLGSGTSHFPAFCFRFCLMVLLSTLALSTCAEVQQGGSENAAWAILRGILHYTRNGGT
jgi:hypothetical protein